MKYTCNNCEVITENYENRTTKTEDNFTICQECYDNTFNELFKGTFTLKEVQEVSKLRHLYTTTLKDFFQEWLKFAVYYEDSIPQFLSKIVTLQEELALKTFNKPRSCLMNYTTDKLSLLMTTSLHINEIYDNIPVADYFGVIVRDNGSTQTSTVITMYERF